MAHTWLPFCLAELPRQYEATRERKKWPQLDLRPHLATEELVPLSRERYHCRSMEGRWLATERYSTMATTGRSGRRHTV